MRKLLIIICIIILIGAIASSFIIKKPSNKLVNNVLPTVPLPVSEATLNEAIQNYLPDNIQKPEFNGKNFCSHYLYGYDEDKTTNLIKAYVWSYCEEYYMDGGVLKMGTGSSFPALIVLELQNGVLGVHGSEIPEDGEGYADSIRNMFPANYAQEAIKGYVVAKFSPNPKQKAQEYFRN